jgi:hypothetical protein
MDELVRQFNWINDIDKGTYQTQADFHKWSSDESRTLEILPL